MGNTLSQSYTITCLADESTLSIEKISKYFIKSEGRLYYIGGQKNSTTTPRLVVETVEERDRIVESVHDQAYLGRNKMLSAVSAKHN